MVTVEAQELMVLTWVLKAVDVIQTMTSLSCAGEAADDLGAAADDIGGCDWTMAALATAAKMELARMKRILIAGSRRG